MPSPGEFAEVCPKVTLLRVEEEIALQCERERHLHSLSKSGNARLFVSH